jgi:NADH:ubiquinone oxidoreductase subunit D
MKMCVEQFADSFTRYLIQNLDEQKSSLQIYNEWVHKEPITPNLEIADKLLSLVPSIRKSDEKLKREFLIDILSKDD